MNEGIIERAQQGLQVILPAKKARPVEWKDWLKVFKDSFRIKAAMLHPFPGKYPKAASVSHCQIDGDDPLAFFVLDRVENLPWFFKARTIVNPKIVSHSNAVCFEREGCMSFPHAKVVRTRRWQMVECEYQTLPFLRKRKKKFYYYRAALIQHETDHNNLVTIYDKKRK